MAEGKDLFSNVYAVPKTFLSDHGESETTESGRSDIYAAQRILERSGIAFQGDAMATFRKENSQLVVRNVSAQMMLVQAFIKNLKAEGSKCIHLTVYDVTIDHKVGDEAS